MEQIHFSGLFYSLAQSDKTKIVINNFLTVSLTDGLDWLDVIASVRRLDDSGLACENDSDCSLTSSALAHI